MHIAKFLVPALVALAAVACDEGSSYDPSAGSDSPEPVDHTDDLLVDDFEDGELLTTPLGTSWFGFSDVDAGGGSMLGAMPWVVEGGYQSAYRLSVPFTLVKGSYMWNPFVGLVATVTQDVSGYEGISYLFRGPAHTVYVQTSDVVDYDFFGFKVPAASTWQMIKVPYAQLLQEGFGAEVPFDVANVTGVSFNVSGMDGATGVFEIDDLYFEKALDIEKGPPDLMVQPASPPAKNAIDSIAIPGPLQEKALAQLDRGYNFTNWLEEGRFASFQYDETTVAQLAAAGFRSLRLPIDLDLYITEKSGAGDDVTLTLHDDLFTILDSFDTWSEAHGLSFTIDYHQYDASLALGDPASVDEVVALWRAVAAHFKNNPRDDIYFELMNEPELSSGVSAPLMASVWTAAATRIITAIRAEDIAHTIIFGDVNWYGIDKLTERTPFSDDNIVYAFHFYDPFIFTHQGASWASMATTRQIPYPYDPARWSEYSSDLGLSNLQPAWIWDQFRSYYQTGTYEALYNRIVLAKRWGVTHGVPVICNEFGAYDRSALPEDRVRYYTDLIGIFRELEIPWQHWFMILEADGTVAPDLAAAFQLDQ